MEEYEYDPADDADSELPGFLQQGDEDALLPA